MFCVMRESVALGYCFAPDRHKTSVVSGWVPHKFLWAEWQFGHATNFDRKLIVHSVSVVARGVSYFPTQNTPLPPRSHL